jgi:hypothetical protein
VTITDKNKNSSREEQTKTNNTNNNKGNAYCIDREAQLFDEQQTLNRKRFAL